MHLAFATLFCPAFATRLQRFFATIFDASVTLLRRPDRPLTANLEVINYLD
jgi:hypothetical protein